MPIPLPVPHDSTTPRRIVAASARATLAALLVVGSASASAHAGGVARLLLTDDTGAPLARQVCAHLYDTYAEVGDGFQSDGSGFLTVPDLPQGKYDLWVEGDLTGDPGGVVYRGIEVQDVGIALSIPRPGRVLGKLMLPDGTTPAVGYVVAVQSGTVPERGTPAERQAAAYARGALTCYAQTTVGDDGSFELRGLTPGKLSLDVRKPGEADPWWTISGVDVTADSATDLGTMAASVNGWQGMFDRRSLDGWAESGLYGQKPVSVDHDTIVLPHGSDMTGITWQRDLPRIDFEVSLQGKRVEGSDFYCGLTFPVNDSYCSLILGGWGGSLVGLSCLDGSDASQNETSTWIEFENERWYRIRLRVTASRITAWLDDKRIVDAHIEGRLISTRWEVDKCQPFGFATWRTTGALRDIRIRRLDAAEIPGA